MRILVPYDGHELSEQAAVMAIDLLAQHSLDVHFLHVVPDAAHLDAGEAAIKAAAERLAASPAQITPVVSVGKPEVEIARYADQHGADLIAMSTHGRSMLARMLVGSVTDRVIRTSPVPVLVFHPPSMSIDRVSPPAGRRLRVLAPFDGSDFAADAVLMSVALLKADLVEVQLMTAIATALPDLQSLARQLLETTAARVRTLGAKVSTVLVQGDAAPSITRLTHEGGFDLVVMSTHGHGMIARAIIGSTTDRAVRISEAPVLVVMPQSMEAPTDPVSGEIVDPDHAEYTAEYHGRVFAFTSFAHKQQFESAPDAYVGNRMARTGRFAAVSDGFAAKTPNGAPPVIHEA
ncbi:MAG: universal stress protein [Chloroflexi bacterium]|nr:universal stress protein [Chloroflexota bacterium]